MPVVMHLPSIDKRIDLDHCNAPGATCTESECCDARDLHVAADDDLLFLPYNTCVSRDDRMPGVLSVPDGDLNPLLLIFFMCRVLTEQ